MTDERRRVGWVRVIEVTVHPLQVAILEALDWIDEPVSPIQFMAMMENRPTHVGTAGYHFRRLADLGVIQMVDTRRVRGATEHFYQPVPD